MNFQYIIMPCTLGFEPMTTRLRPWSPKNWARPFDRAQSIGCSLIPFGQSSSNKYSLLHCVTCELNFPFHLHQPTIVSLFCAMIILQAPPPGVLYGYTTTSFILRRENCYFYNFSGTLGASLSVQYHKEMPSWKPGKPLLYMEVPKGWLFSCL